MQRELGSLSEGLLRDIATGIAREAPRWSQPILDPIMRAFFAPPHVAARPILYMACARSLGGGRGRYFYRFDEKPPADPALDPALGAKLYDASVALLAERAPHPTEPR